MNDVIVTRQLTLGYAANIILSQLDLSIKQGEFIGIFGANGSGKSTFLRAILGLLRPLHGEIIVLGEIPKHGNNQIGYMPQMRSRNATANLTSRTLLHASAYFLAFPIKAVTEIIALVQAESYADRPFYQLSGGEKQRIHLAQALLGYPPLLLLDEPLANLDPRYQDTFIRLLQDIQRQLNVTILFTAHDPNPLLSVMNRVLYFAKGRGVIGNVTEIITTEVLSRLYETTIEVVQHNDRLIVLGEDRCLGEH